jgi:hypothetical protein
LYPTTIQCDLHCRTPGRLEFQLIDSDFGRLKDVADRPHKAIKALAEFRSGPEIQHRKADSKFAHNKVSVAKTTAMVKD